MAQRTWIVVANGSVAQVYAQPGIGKPLELINTIETAFSGLRASAIGADRPGRSFQRFGEGRSAMEFHTELPRVEKEKIAHRTGDFLITRSHRKAFDRLVLVASPEMLGLLREELKDIEGQIAAELAKDLSQCSPQELPKRLREADVMFV